MHHPTALRICLWIFIFARCLVSPVAAQPKPPANIKMAVSSNAVVDVVSLKSGRNLRGVVFSAQPSNPVSVIVSLAWYRDVNPGKSDEVVAENVEQRRLAWTQTRDRIAERLKQPSQSPQFDFFLKQESARIERQLADRQAPEPEFLWIDVPSQTIAKVTKATPDDFRLALFAWNERLEHVEKHDAASLKKELTKRGIKLDGPTPDLWDRLTPRTQNEREWTARMALFEYTLIKPLDFQGTANAAVQVERGQPVNLAEILPKLLQQQLGSILQDLTGDNRIRTKPQTDSETLDPAIQQAQSTKSHAFRTSKVDIDAAAGRVSIDSRFVAQVDASNWQTIWRSTVTEDGTKPRATDEARIEQDPQIKSLIDGLKSFSLVDRETIQRAIRVGAATMAAQQAADSQFEEFRERYTRRLDGPPLQVSGADR